MVWSKNYSRARAIDVRFKPGEERRPLTLSSFWKATSGEHARMITHQRERP